MKYELHREEAARSPSFDSWRRAQPGTPSNVIITDAVENTSDVRLRPNTTGNSRKRKAKDQITYEAQVDAVLSAVIHRELTRPGGWTRIPLGHARSGSKRNNKSGAERYRSQVMSRSLPYLVKALSERGWIELEVGRIEAQERLHSIMRASPMLRDYIRDAHCRLTDFGRYPDQEVIILKGHKPHGRDGRGRPLPAPWLDYDDTSETTRMRAELSDINAWLASCDVTYEQEGVGIDPLGGRTLRRIFNNGSFEEGGRLFDGFWLNMSMAPKNYGRLWRGHLRIAGEPVVALDFVSMFLRLLYTIAGVQPPSGDLLAGIEGLGPEYREGTKRLIYAMLFREGELKKKPKGTSLMLPKSSHTRTLVKSIGARHAPVAHLFGTAIGMRLFRLESDIIMAALRHCRALGITALPIHDALLVAESKAADATRAMLDAFQEVTGFQGEVGEPKSPAIDAAELETTPMPDDVRCVEDDPHERPIINSLLREGHRDYAIKRTLEYEDRMRPLDDPNDGPDGVGDWA